MEQPKSYGAVVASIIIILVLIVGALYFWGKTLEERAPVVPEQNIATTTESTDTIDSISNDLNDTKDLKDVETGLKAI
ncbi:MAG: hypothetical protein WCJ74_02940 [bacterium]